MDLWFTVGPVGSVATVTRNRKLPECEEVISEDVEERVCAVSLV